MRRRNQWQGKECPSRPQWQWPDEGWKSCCAHAGQGSADWFIIPAPALDQVWGKGKGPLCYPVESAEPPEDRNGPRPPQTLSELNDVAAFVVRCLFSCSLHVCCGCLLVFSRVVLHCVVRLLCCTVVRSVLFNVALWWLRLCVRSWTRFEAFACLACSSLLYQFKGRGSAAMPLTAKQLQDEYGDLLQQPPLCDCPSAYLVPL